MNGDTTKATDFVADWVAAHRDQFQATDHTSKWSTQNGRTFCADFETPTHFIQLCAWDHACCLDIQALNKDTGAHDYIVAGECAGTPALAQRLDAFLHWITVNKRNSQDY